MIHSFLGKLLETIRLTAIRKICYFWPQIPLALSPDYQAGLEKASY